jgi:hypothetical protein
MYSVNPSYYCFISCHTCILYLTLPFVSLPPFTLISTHCFHAIAWNLVFPISFLTIEVSVLSYIYYMLDCSSHFCAFWHQFDC